jgi:hypothetical protein
VNGILLATLWLTLAVAKALKPAQFFAFLEGYVGPWAVPLGWALIALESMAGCLALASAFRPAWTRAAAACSLALSLMLVCFAVVLPVDTCGCFGALGTATRMQRLIVALSVAFLALRLVQRNPQTSRGRRIRMATSSLALALALMAVLGVVPRTSGSGTAARELPVQATSRRPGSAPGLRSTRSPPRQAPGDSHIQPGESALGGESVMITGRVEAPTPEGLKPVRGAFVYATVPGESRVDVSAAVRTEEGGEFKLSYEWQRGLVIRSVASGWAPAQVPAPAASGIVDLRLERGVRISGSVQNARGEPLAGVDVWCLPSGERAVGFPGVSYLPGAGQPRGAHCVSDDRGLWVLAGLAAESYLIKASRSGMTFRPKRPLLVTAPGEDVVVRLHDSYLAHVRLMDGETGTPVAVTHFDYEVSAGLEKGVVPSRRWAAGDFLRSQTEFTLEIAASGAERATEPSITLELAVFGYQRKRVRIPLVAGADVSKTIELMPTDRPRTLLQVRAVYPDGRGYDGPLALQLGVQGERPGVFFVGFSNGRLDRPLHVPAGRYVMGVSGRGATATAQWVPASRPQQVDLVARPEAFTVHFEVVGNPLRLEVLTASGQVVDTYDVRLEVDGVPKPWLRNVRRLAPTGDPQILMVGRGDVRIRVNHCRYGYGEAQLRAPGDGAPLRATVRLDPKRAIDLDATRDRLLREMKR